jgi:hypothetical protein
MSKEEELDNIIKFDLFVRVQIIKAFRKVRVDKDGILILPKFFSQNINN